jgi:general L-amino acid transport system permease protein
VTGGAGAPAPPDVPDPEPGPSPGRGRGGVSGLVFNVRVLRVAGQVAAIVVLLVLAAYLADNYRANIADRNARSGWGFLDEPTGFNIAFEPDFRSGQPVRDALRVGVINTAASALVGIVLATIIGVVVGVLRLSNSWVARKTSTLYVEVIRNLPVLLVILFLYAGLLTLPRIEEARELDGLAVISNRAIAVMSPVAGDNLGIYLVLLAAGVLGALALAAWRTRVSNATGAPDHRILWGGGLLLAVAIGGYYALGAPLTWSHPQVEGRGVVGGITLNIPYVAITFALAVYHGSHIAEIVRGSVQAVPHGQTEAATAIGLSDIQRLRFVVLPQAFRIAVPPTINQYLSLIKNTSLGIAVAYSDVASLAFRLVGSSRAPALQMVLVLMAIYLTFSLLTSFFLNILNRRLQLVER